MIALRQFAHITIVIVAVCLACTSTDGSTPQPLRLPFKSVRDMVYLRVSFNGSPLVWVNVDTGASHSVIDSTLATALGIVQTASGEASGIGRGESTTYGRVEDATIQVGAHILRRQSLLILSTDFIASQLGHETEGTLGSNLFENYVVRIDYLQRQVSLEDPASWKPDQSGEEIPIEVRANMPFVRAGITLSDGREVTGTFLIDSGMIGAAVSLNDAFQAAHAKLLSSYPAITPPPASAVGGRFDYKITRIPVLRIGSFRFKDPITMLPARAAGIQADPSVAGLIRADVLSRFTVVFDYLHHRIFLKPNERFTQTFETDMSGLRLTARSPMFQRFEISGVAAHSPGSDAGLREGDIIVAVDGQAAATLTLAQIQTGFERTGEQRRLTILRGGHEFQVDLRLKRLI
jgi:hypothetical protein